MKGIFKKTVTILVILTIVLSVLSVLFISASAADYTITVELIPDSKKAAEDNWYTLYDAINEMSPDSGNVTVRISASGTYYIGKTDSPAAIRLHSNTVLDLNNSTIIRYGKMGNVFQNCDYDGDTYNGSGYSLTSNITIKNGTVDGSYVVSSDYEGVNLLNFGHASGIYLKNLYLTNCQGAHLVEFTGCENVHVEECVFDGYTSSDLSGSCEALQLDICAGKSTGGQEWNGVYCDEKKGTGADNTPCQNVYIDRCTFMNFPSAIGNHKGVKGKYTSNVYITDCYFHNTLDSSQPAIWAYNFKNSEITGNSISGNYGTGIYVSGGTNNTISGNDVILDGTALYITVASASYVIGGNGTKDSMYVSKCKVLNNDLSTVGDVPAVCVYTGSHISEFTGNTVCASNEKAITITTDSKADLIKNNTIDATGTSTSSYGLHLAGSTIGTVSGNTINSFVHAIQVSSDATVTEISGNTLVSDNGDGMYISSSTVGTVSNNTVKDCACNSISILSSAKVSTVSGNTLTNSGAYAISLKSDASVTDISGNTIDKTVSDGIYVSSATIGTLSKNTVKNCSGNALAVLSSGKITTVSDNKISSSGSNAVSVKSSGTITDITNNTINTASGDGIYISGATVKNITSNLIKSCTNGINITGDGKVTSVTYNALRSNSNNGIWIKNTSITVKLGNNIFSGNKGTNQKISSKTSNVTKAGWGKIGGKWYYFNSDGTYKTGWQKISKKWYYFDKSGQMLTGWQQISKKWYYFNSSGVMLTGWQKISKKWYYFNSSGVMLTGWQKISGDWYYFNSSGAMKTGWLQLSGKWYYFKSSGVMVSNCSLKIGSKTYKFDKNGVCLNP